VSIEAEEISGGGGDPELSCPWVVDVERLPSGASTSTDQNTLQLASLDPFEYSHFFLCLFL
jgi:hypothetical protein